MAIDTRNRRASCLGFALAALVILPAPDAVIDASDQSQVAMAYAGLAVVEPELAALVMLFGTSTDPIMTHATSSAPVIVASISTSDVQT